MLRKKLTFNKGEVSEQFWILYNEITSETEQAMTAYPEVDNDKLDDLYRSLIIIMILKYRKLQ